MRKVLCARRVARMSNLARPDCSSRAMQLAGQTLRDQSENGGKARSDEHTCSTENVQCQLSDESV